MITYDVLIISIVGTINESLAIVSAIVGIIRLDILKRKETVETTSEEEKELPEEEKEKIDQ